MRNTRDKAQRLGRAMKAAGLTRSGQTIALCLWGWRDWHTDQVRASVASLADASPYCARQVQRALRELTTAGVIEEIQRGGGRGLASRYRFCEAFLSPAGGPEPGAVQDPETRTSDVTLSDPETRTSDVMVSSGHAPDKGRLQMSERATSAVTRISSSPTSREEDEEEEPKQRPSAALRERCPDGQDQGLPEPSQTTPGPGSIKIAAEIADALDERWKTLAVGKVNRDRLAVAAMVLQVRSGWRPDQIREYALQVGKPTRSGDGLLSTHMAKAVDGGVPAPAVIRKRKAVLSRCPRCNKPEYLVKQGAEPEVRCPTGCTRLPRKVGPQDPYFDQWRKAKITDPIPR